MANYNSLKATIDANVKQNGVQAITGQILNSVLNQMVTTLGAGYQFAGVATLDPATDPGTPDAKVFYIANGKGTYTNFGGLVVTEDDVVVLYWDSSWHKVSTGIASQAKLSELEGKFRIVAAPMAINSIADGWKLLANGLCISDSTARLKKYLVTAGSVIYLKLSADTEGVYQFQSAASVPSNGTNANLIGTTVTEVTDSYVKVPIGATYLIVSELNTNDENVVESTKETSASEIKNQVLSFEGMFEQNIDLSLYAGQKYYDDNGTWKVGLPSYTGFIVPCKSRQIFIVQTQESVNTFVSFVKNLPVNDTAILYAEGWSRTELSSNMIHTLTTPDDANYLWVSSKSGSWNNIPLSILIQSKFLTIAPQFLSDSQKADVLNNLGIKTTIEQATNALPYFNGILGRYVDSNPSGDWKVWASGISLKRGNLYKINVTLTTAADTKKYFYLSDATNDSGVKYIVANVAAGDTTGYGYLYAQGDVNNLNIISLGVFTSAEVIFSTDTLVESINKLLSNSVLTTPFSYTEEDKVIARDNIGLSVVKDGKEVIEADGYIKSDGTYGNPLVGWKRSGKIALESIFDDTITLSVSTSGDNTHDAAALVAYDANEQFIGFIRNGFTSVAKNTLPVGTKYIALSFYNKQSCVIVNSNILDGLKNLNNKIEGIANPAKMDYLAKKDKIEQLGYIRAASDAKPLLFMHVSDTHGSAPLGYVEQMKFAISCLNDLSVNRTGKNNNVKFLLHTGDIHRSNPKGDDYDYTYFESAVAESTKPVFVAVGNHDVGETQLVANSATNLDVYNQMIAPMLTSWALKTDGGGVPHPQNANYYFTDFTDEKVRLIVLYEYETDFEIDSTDSTRLVAPRSVRSFSQAQIDWLVDSLMTTPANYGVIIAKHQPEATVGNTDNPFSSPYTKGTSPMYSAVDKKMICEIVDAFMNGTTISKSYVQSLGIVTTLNVSADFSQKNTGAEFICYCSGHLHCDSVNFIQEFPSQLELNIGVDNDIQNYTSGSDMMQLKTTKSENLINVYSIDRLRGQIHIVRIGADFSNSGQDRSQTTINYK